MSLNLGVILRESAKRHSEKTAIVIGDTLVSYGQLHAYAQKLAGSLKRLGVHRGQHVALMLPNVPQFTIAYYAIHYIGAVVVPLNVLLKPDEIHYHLEDSDSVALIVWEGFAEHALAAFPRADVCKHLIIAKADPSDVSADEGVHNMTALIGTGEPVAELPDTMPDDTAVMLYTSGTTGRPKGAELTHFNMFYNAEYASTKLMPLNADTTALAVLPLFHSFGQTVIQNGVLSVGGTIVLLPRFEPTAAFELMKAHGVTLFAGVPTMYFALLNHPMADEVELGLKYCAAGGAAMPVKVMKAFDDKFGVNILEGYGLSETSPVASFNTLDRPKKAGSIGTPIWGVEFRLEKDDGSVVEANDEPGEICIRGHNVMKGYYKRPEVNAEQIKDGWFHTGDIATRDADGFYFIVDRKKDMIIRGGFNVYPREIEEVLYAHPAIAEAAVIGVPHERHGEEVKAVVALKAGQSASEQDLIDYCKEKLAAYKYPRIVSFLDALPKGPTGKILKRELRD
jgi:long-chain acyl-CoA synthetase